MDERIPEDIENGHRKNPLARIHLLIGFVAAVTVASMGHEHGNNSVDCL
jgi:hypothetical protein